MKDLPAPVLEPLPFVYVNMGMSADGKIATANRSVTSFGSEADQAHLLELRVGADAVMAGARTVDSAPVTMGPGSDAHRQARRRAGRRESNLRIIVSGSGSIRLDAEVFRHRFSPIVILTTERISRARLRELQGVADEVRVCGCNNIDFASTLRWLRRQWGVERLLCEGGGDLNVALFRAGLVDEVHLTVCPWIVGGVEAPTIADGIDPRRLADAVPYEVSSMRMEGDEAFLVLGRPSATAPGPEGGPATAASSRSGSRRQEARRKPTAGSSRGRRSPASGRRGDREPA